MTQHKHEHDMPMWVQQLSQIVTQTQAANGTQAPHHSCATCKTQWQHAEAHLDIRNADDTGGSDRLHHCMHCAQEVLQLQCCQTACHCRKLLLGLCQQCLKPSLACRCHGTLQL